MRTYNKKGDASSKVIYYIAFLMLFGFVSLAFSTTTKNFIEEKYPLPSDLDIVITSANIVNNCFAYVDEQTQQTMQNVLDEEKITDQNLKNCFQTSQYYENIKVTIKSKQFVTKVVKTTDFKPSETYNVLCSMKLIESGEIVPCQMVVER